MKRNFDGINLAHTDTFSFRSVLGFKILFDTKHLKEDFVFLKYDICWAWYSIDEISNDYWPFEL